MKRGGSFKRLQALPAPGGRTASGSRGGGSGFRGARGGWKGSSVSRGTLGPARGRAGGAGASRAPRRQTLTEAAEAAASAFKNHDGAPLDPESSLADELTEEQRRVLEAVANEESVFLTGRAGCGKSKTLHVLIACLRDAGTPHAVTAFTGVAAEPLGGSTLHSYLCMGLDDDEDPEVSVKRVKTKRPSVADVRVLIIDEISMVPEKLLRRALDILEAVRSPAARKLVLVATGDFLQLAPVRAERMLNSPLWTSLNLTVVLLRGSHRQKGDDAFLRLLDEARFGELSPASVALLESRVGADLKLPPTMKATRLLAIKVGVESINKAELAELRGKRVAYHGCVFVGTRKDPCGAPELNLEAEGGAACAGGADDSDAGTSSGWLGPSGSSGGSAEVVRLRAFVTPAKDEWEPVATSCNLWQVDSRTSCVPPAAGLESDAVYRGLDILLLRNMDVWGDAKKMIAGTLSAGVLELVRGAQVMFTANISPTVVNGTQAVVCGFHGETRLPVVCTARGEIVVVKPRISSRPVTPGIEMPCTAFIHMPLQLAWAWTVHKSQGQTLDNIDVDLGDTVFEDCQAYVALSRARTLDGVRLSKLCLRSIRAPAHIVQYYKDLEAAAEAEDAQRAAKRARIRAVASDDEASADGPVGATGEASRHARDAATDSDTSDTSDTSDDDDKD
jgi:hypothetical protein